MNKGDVARTQARIFGLLPGALGEFIGDSVMRDRVPVERVGFLDIPRDARVGMLMFMRKSQGVPEFMHRRISKSRRSVIGA